MKKNTLMAFIALLTTSFVFAQVSTTPEVPRNYKPKLRELLPMPDSLTTADIFPVLGKYSIATVEGDSSNIYITLDDESKGVVWVSGLSQGKFRADLKAFPAVYKIPSQKTFRNDAAPEETVSDNAAETTGQKTAKVLSGKSVQEGTMIYDKESNVIYINLGTKFKAEDPASIFPDLIVPADTSFTSTDVAANQPQKKPKVAKGINYKGVKAIEVLDGPLPVTQ